MKSHLSLSPCIKIDQSVRASQPSLVSRRSRKAIAARAVFKAYVLLRLMIQGEDKYIHGQIDLGTGAACPQLVRAIGWLNDQLGRLGTPTIMPLRPC